MAKRNKLGESQSLQQFNRDADEVDTWMLEKMQTASDESYKDPTNLQVNVIYCIGRTLVGIIGAAYPKNTKSDNFKCNSCTYI